MTDHKIDILDTTYQRKMIEGASEKERARMASYVHRLDYHIAAIAEITGNSDVCIIAVKDGELRALVSDFPGGLDQLADLLIRMSKNENGAGDLSEAIEEMVLSADDPKNPW